MQRSALDPNFRGFRLPGIATSIRRGLLAAIVGFAASSALAVNYSVNSNGDTGAGSGTSGDLRYCITQANSNAGSTITFNASLGTITLASRLPVISVAMTIDGGNNTVSGNNQFRVFFISPLQANAAINISNLTIANGLATGGAGGGSGGGGAGMGGGMFVDAGNVRLQNVVFNNCGAVGGAGGSGITQYNGYGGGGGGGGLHGAGGVRSDASAGGGGGYGGTGGTGGSIYSSGTSEGGGGGGGIVGRGANGSHPFIGEVFGGGGGGPADAIDSQGVGGGGNGGVGRQAGQPGGYYGGGGGGGYGNPNQINQGSEAFPGGAGGKYGGGGGASGTFNTSNNGGNGGDFGGGGGSAGQSQTWSGGAGGYGAGGGGGAFGDVGIGRAGARGGAGGFGAGGGGGGLSGSSAPGGTFGGRGGAFVEYGSSGYRVGGGGGGGALGGAIFVRGANGASVTIADGSVGTGSLAGGAPGPQPTPDPSISSTNYVSPSAGSTAGRSVFLHGGLTKFEVSSGNTGTIPASTLSGFQAAGIEKTGPGTLIFGDNNSFGTDGQLKITDGTMNFGFAAACPPVEQGALNLPLLTADGGTLNLNGHPTTVAILRGNAGRIVNDGIPIALTVNGAADSPAQIFSGVIADSSDGALICTGAGFPPIPYPRGGLHVIFNTYLFLRGANTYSHGTTIIGGELFLETATATLGASTGSLTISGGRLNLFQGGNLQIGVLNGTGGVIGKTSVGPGSTLTIDTNAFSAGSYAGVIQDNTAAGISQVALTKAGPGSQTLSGANSYTGATNVTGGTLLIAQGGLLATTPVTVASAGSFIVNGNTAGLVNVSGTVGGTGAIANTVTINSGGNIAPGNSVGTLTVNALTLQGGSRLTYEFSASSNDRVDETSANGLTINGGSISVYDEGTTTSFSRPGTYQLIGYNGMAQGSAIDPTTHTVAFVVSNPAPGATYAFIDNVATHTIDMIVTFVPVPTPTPDPNATPTPTPAATPGFNNTGGLNGSRNNHTATLLSNGKVLVAGGVASQFTGLNTAELYDPATGGWTPTGSFTDARFAHTATSLPNGKVLIVGGNPNNFQGAPGAQLYDPATGVWSSTGNMAGPRQGHTATSLADGRVVVIGGLNPTTFGMVTTAEIYDWTTGTWSTANGNMAVGRRNHTATLLASGKVLVVGGENGPNSTATTELFDPANGGSWSSAGSLPAGGRYLHTATRLPNGKVLIAGGSDVSGSGTSVATAELYDPASGWQATGPLITARRTHTASLLTSGKVLVAGGDSDAAAKAELYDPASGTWTATVDLTTGRSLHTATLLPSGKVLLAGSAAGNGASAELFDLGGGTWSNATNLSLGRSDHTSTLLPDGTALVAGGLSNGSPVASTERYNPASGTWSAGPSMGHVHAAHTATLLRSGKVLVVGGGGAPASAELFDPVNNNWLPAPDLAVGRYNHSATLLSGGRVLVAGGFDSSNNPVTSAELYNPGSGTWSAAGSLAAARAGHRATLLPNGKVIVTGGSASGGGALASAEIFDPATNSWSAAANMITARTVHSATLLPSGKVLVAGGLAFSGALASAEIYDVAANSWTAIGDLSSARGLHSATLLPNGKVLVAGGRATDSIASAQLYDPATSIWSLTAPSATARHTHTATLLPNGTVLFAGGTTSGTTVTPSAELYDIGLGFMRPDWQPQTATSNSTLAGGDRLTLSGSRFRGISGASGGNYQDSATNYPVVQLRSLGNEQVSFLLAEPAASWSDADYQSAPVIGFTGGPALATVFTNGIPGDSKYLTVLPPNSAPIAIAQSLQASAGSPVPVTLTGFDDEGDALTFSVVNGPAHGALTGTAPNLTYTADANYAGPDSFTFKANDGTIDSSPATVSVTVTEPDTTPPDVIINQAAGQADPTNGSTINFTAEFSEAMTGFTSTDVILSGDTGAITVNVSGFGTTYNVAVSGMTADGSVTVAVPAGAANDLAGNPNTASTSSDSTVTRDTTAPAVLISSPSSSISNGTGAVTYNVTYNDPHFSVSTLSASDVTLNRTGSANATVGVSGSGNVWTVTLSGVTGDGTLGISIAADTASDSAGNTAPAAGPSATFTVDTTPPAVTINQDAGQNDPTHTSPINFTVVFSEPVANFATGDVILGGSAGATTAMVTGSGTTYNVAVSGMAQDGTVTATVAASVATDEAGNANTASTSTDNTVTYDNTRPTINLSAPSASAANGSSTVTYTVTYNDANFTGSSLSAGDVTLNKTDSANATVAVDGGTGATRTVTLSNVTGQGTLGISVASGTASDSAGNLAPAAGPSATFSVDAISPTVTINQASGQSDPAMSEPIKFTVVFSEAVTGFDGSDVTISGTAAPGATAAVTESAPNNGTTYNVDISGMLGNGMLTATISANKANDAAGNGNTASTSTDNTVLYVRFDLLSTFEVNSTADTDDGVCAPAAIGNGCTLREAINAANADAGAETISFNIAGPGPHTIQLTGPLPDLVGSVDILNTSGQRITVRRDTGGDYRIFTIPAGLIVRISGLTITNGNSGSGGGIYNAGTLTLTNSTISGNFSGDNGGGIFNGGTLTITNSTISGNGAAVDGSGIYHNGASLILTSVTIAQNLGDPFLYGGNTVASGLSGPGPALLRNTIVAENLSNRSVDFGNGFGVLQQHGEKNIGVRADPASSFNLIGAGATAPFGPDHGGLTNGTDNNQIGVAARLAPLADHGGLTQTHGLLPGSPALDQGKDFTDSGEDQRGPGFARPVDIPRGPNAEGGDGSDIGAYEVQAGPDADADGVPDEIDGCPDTPAGTTVNSGGCQAVFVVNSTRDTAAFGSPTDGTCDTGSTVTVDGNTVPECTLRAAVQEANGTPGENTILTEIPDAGPHTIGLLSALPALSESVDILNTSGKTVTIQRTATSAFNILVSSFGRTNLAGLIFSNGGGIANTGGSIQNFGSLTLTNCTITDARRNGISSGSSATINLVNSTVTGSALAGIRVDPSGSGVGDRGGPIRLAITNSTISGNVQNGIFAQPFSGPPAFSITVSNSNVSGNGRTGIAIRRGALIVTNSTISGNTNFTFGGGISASTSADTVIVTNSTISGNSAVGGGGGILAAGHVTLTSVTITNNRVGSASNPSATGGGLLVSGGATALLRNTIIAGNYRDTGTTTADDIALEGPGETFPAGTVDATSSYNLIGTGGSGGLVNGANNNQVGIANPGLGALANNGGLTETHALLPGSPALDAGNNTLASDAGLTTDQRGTGFGRIRDAASDADTTQTADIGAFEADPSIEDISDKSTPEDTTLEFLFNVGDGATPFDSITATSSDTTLVPPGNISVNPDTASTRKLSITPAANLSGTATITVTATKTISGTPVSMSDTFLLTVGAVNDAPTADDQSVTTNEDTAKSIILTGSDVEGSPVTFSVVSTPMHGVLTGTEPNLTYTPNANYNGPDSFAFTANDGTLDSAPATVSIAVNAINDAPTANPQSVTTSEDTAKAITVSGGDIDGDTLAFTVMTGPSHGTLSGTAPNLTYTPNANYNGPDSFTFKTNDGAADSNVATVSIAVTAVNDAPFFVKGPDQTVPQGSGSQTVPNWATNISAGPADESGQALTFMLTNNNNGLFATQPAVSANGTLSYTPASNAAGSVTVTVSLIDNGGTANGGQNTSPPQSFTITVTPAPASPTPTATATATPTATATATPTATATATPTATATASPTPRTVPTPAQALNISTRLRVDVGDKVMIGGFIIRGSEAKPVIIRGLGPSLATMGVPTGNVLNDPVLELHGPDGSLIISNDDWKDSPQRSQLEGTMFQPADDREAVILATLQPGPYTAILKGSNQTMGVGIVEIYDMDQATDSDLANISTRGFVKTVDEVMIGGFMVGGNNAPTQIAVRAIGPSLATLGLANALADPTLEMHDANGAIMLSNDNWQDNPVSAEALTANGLAPNDPLEAGIFIPLPPGDYTVILAGKNGGIGIGLVEIYNLR